MAIRGRALATVLLVALPCAVPSSGQTSETGGGIRVEPPRIVVLSPAAPSTPTRPVPIVSLSVKEADLVEVVRSMARIAGVNLVIDPGVEGKVTAELRDVRWDHALGVILKTQGLAMELDGRILTVAPPRRLMGAQ